VTDEPTLNHRIAALWRELLHIEHVSPADHFIALGGNSMLATLLANRIERDLGVRPSVTDLFNTLQSVVETCEELLADQDT
jgi:hypothetical protein